MKYFTQLSADLDNFSNKLLSKLIKAQKNVSKKIYKDVKAGAPVSTGEYLSSIQISNTVLEKNIIKTDIYTDLTSSDNEKILIGRMIENGTGIYALEPHIGKTKTFINSGYRYWYVPTTSVKRSIGTIVVIDGKEFYIAHAQPAKPHFKPALDKNISLYHAEIRKAVKEAKK